MCMHLARFERAIDCAFKLDAGMHARARPDIGPVNPARAIEHAFARARRDAA